MKLYPLEVTSVETSTSPTLQPANEHPEEESLTLTSAAERARRQMSEWIQAICAPPEDVRNTSDND